MSVPLSLSVTGTLCDVWRRHRDASPEREAIVHWSADSEPFRWSWDRLVERSERFAALLTAAGVRRGDVCALVLRHHRDFYPLYMGIEALGGIPAVLAYPNPRLHPDKFRQGLSGMAQRSGIEWLLTQSDLDGTVRDLTSAPGSTIKGILFPFEWEEQARGHSFADVSQLNPDVPCLLQHSSGTTGLQKPVMLSHRAVLTHLHHYGRTLGLNSTDRVVSWLPLYHDMGLIAAFHLPLAYGIPAIHIDPFEWIAVPSLFLTAASRERATIAWMPNFAYNVLADRVDDDELDGVRLDSLRLLINCSEPIRAESHARLLARFECLGLHAESLATCYAMAETTFAVCQSVPGEIPPRVVSSRSALARGQFVSTAEGEESRTCVSSGRPIPDCEVEILDQSGDRVGDARIGELVVRSSSMFDGYRNNPEQTTAVLKHGWYHTGDLGFCLGEDYYIIGRSKDLIIVAGKNIYPEDVEDAVSSVDGVLPGRVVACGIENATFGTDDIWVIAETTFAAEDRAALRLSVLRAGMAIDVTINRVELVEPRWLIKSSAGKPSRRANIERLLSLINPTVT